MRTKRNRNTQSPKDGAKQYGPDTGIKERQLPDVWDSSGIYRA